MDSLETARLSLRPVLPSDAADIGALLQDPGVFRFMLDGAPASEAFVRDLISQSAAEFDRGAAGVFSASLRDGRRAIGLAGFRRAEIGGVELLCAILPSLWGKGLAAEACEACLAFAGRVGLREVLAAADAPNARSLRLIERLGFRPLRETPGAFGVIRWFVRVNREDGR